MPVTMAFSENPVHLDSSIPYHGRTSLVCATATSLITSIDRFNGLRLTKSCSDINTCVSSSSSSSSPHLPLLSHHSSFPRTSPCGFNPTSPVNPLYSPDTLRQASSCLNLTVNPPPSSLTLAPTTITLPHTPHPDSDSDSDSDSILYPHSSYSSSHSRFASESASESDHQPLASSRPTSVMSHHTFGRPSSPTSAPAASPPPFSLASPPPPLPHRSSPALPSLSRRPVTAPSASMTATTPHNTSLRVVPVPLILAHAPTRTRLASHLLATCDSHALGTLLLILDLLAILRGSASQTAWSFDDPPLHHCRRRDIDAVGQPARPGTADPTPTRCQLSATVFKLTKARPAHHRPRTALGTSSSTPSSWSHHPDHPRSSPPPERECLTSSDPWLSHLRELYCPELSSGPILPFQLPSDAASQIRLIQCLRKAAAAAPGLATAPAMSELKEVGQLACEELAGMLGVKAWWDLQRAGLVKELGVHTHCSYFADLLRLWPSLTFPTPATSQLYRVSSILVSNSRTHHAPLSGHRCVLASLFEVHFAPPGQSDLDAIDALCVAQPPPIHSTASNDPPIFSNPFASSESSEPSLTITEDDESDSDSLKPPGPDLAALRNQKLRRFFGQEFEPMALVNQSLCNVATIPSLVSLGRRKSAAQEEAPGERDRPRKRSTPTHALPSMARPYTAPPPSRRMFSQTRLTVVGTEPTATPTFSSFLLPTVPNAFQSDDSSHANGLSYSSDEELMVDEDDAIGDWHPTAVSKPGSPVQPMSRASLEFRPEPVLFRASRELQAELARSCDSVDQQPNLAVVRHTPEARRLTKAERIFGEPVSEFNRYDGLTVRVVTEVIHESKSVKMTSARSAGQKTSESPSLPSRHRRYRSDAAFAPPGRSEGGPESGAEHAGFKNRGQGSKGRLSRLHRFLADSAPVPEATPGALRKRPSLFKLAGTAHKDENLGKRRSSNSAVQCKPVEPNGVRTQCVQSIRSARKLEKMFGPQADLITYTNIC